MNNKNFVLDATEQWEYKHCDWISRFEHKKNLHPTHVFSKVKYFLNLSNTDFNKIIHAYCVKNQIDLIDIDEARTIAKFQSLVTNFINRLLGQKVNFVAPYTKEMSLALMTKIVEFSHITLENLQSKPDLHCNWRYDPFGYFHINYIENNINNYICVYPDGESIVRCYCTQTGESIYEKFSNVNLFSHLQTFNGDS